MKSDAIASPFRRSINPVLSLDQPFLSDVSPDDKPWDVHKLQAVKVSQVLISGHSLQQRQSGRMHECAHFLEFGWQSNEETGETALKLKSARFCRVRICPICQWRRSLMWVARFFNAFPKIYADHPEWRYIFLTLTVRNCPVTDLKVTISTMNAAFKRLQERKTWPGLGFLRSLEVTRSNDGTAHPHFHCLIAVPPGYFVGRKYLSTAKWANLWQDCLRVDYTPICDVRSVKPKREKSIFKQTDIDDLDNGLMDVMAVKTPDVWYQCMDMPNLSAISPTFPEYLMSAIKEVVKYAVKPSDLLLDPFWLLELSNQLHNSRSVTVGGLFKDYLRDDDEETDDDLIAENETGQANDGGVFFGWRERHDRYQRKHNHEK